MSDEELKSQADAYVDEVWEDVVEDIRTLVKIRSVEDLDHAKPGMPWGPASHEALEAGLKIAERLGLDAHDCEGYIGYADLPGESEKQVATIAHTDVVPEGLGWTVDSFDVTRKDGYLMGRGVLDDKGPFILSLYAAHFFARQVRETGKKLPYTLRCIVGNDEETTMGDVTWYLQHFDEPAFCFSPDADFPLICGEKGVFHGRVTSNAIEDEDRRIVSLDAGTVVNAIPGLATAIVRAKASELAAQDGIEVEDLGDGTCRITAHGKGGHASLPAGTVNAIGVLANYRLEQGVCNAKERRFLEFESRLLARTDGATVALRYSDDVFGPLTLIGGTLRTRGDRFEQTIDCRYPNSVTAERIRDAMSGVCFEYGYAFETIQDKAPFYISPDAPEIKVLLDTYREYTGDGTEPLVIGGGTYARKFSHACAFGPHRPLKKEPDWVGPEHGADEAIAEEDLREALKIYIVSIARLMQLEL